MQQPTGQRPPFPTYPRLSDDTVVLRQVEMDEVSQIVSISFYDAKQANSVQEAAAMLQRINEDYRAGSCIHWGIEASATQQLVGTCGYYRGFENGRGELGCVLLARFRGQGYMSKALKLAIAFGQMHMGLQEIVAITGRQNGPAIRLLEGLGFREVAALADGFVEYSLGGQCGGDAV